MGDLYALDFDGVLCDSCGESSLSAVKVIFFLCFLNVFLLVCWENYERVWWRRRVLTHFLCFNIIFFLRFTEKEKEKKEKSIIYFFALMDRVKHLSRWNSKEFLLLGVQKRQENMEYLVIWIVFPSLYAIGNAIEIRSSIWILNFENFSLVLFVL